VITSGAKANRSNAASFGHYDRSTELNVRFRFVRRPLYTKKMARKKGHPRLPPLARLLLWPSVAWGRLEKVDAINPVKWLKEVRKGKVTQTVVHSRLSRTGRNVGVGRKADVAGSRTAMRDVGKNTRELGASGPKPGD
jgi:hypothetical protein